MKNKTITLECLWSDQPKSDYRVKQITNSVEYKPGQIVTHAEAAELCEAKSWNVVMVRA